MVRAFILILLIFLASEAMAENASISSGPPVGAVVTFSVSIIDGDELEKPIPEAADPTDMQRGHTSKLTGTDSPPAHIGLSELEDMVGNIVQISREGRHAGGKGQGLADDMDYLRTQYVLEGLRRSGIRLDEGLKVQMKRGRLYLMMDDREHEISQRFGILETEHIGAGKTPASIMLVMEDRPFYLIRIRKECSVMGLMQTDMTVVKKVDAKNLRLMGIDGPWWGALAW